MSLQTKRFYKFADFRLDLLEKVLIHEGKPVPLTPKVFATLQILLENPGHLLEKDFLMQKIWQDRFVEENNLTFNIKMLRKALGDSVAEPRFIETVPKRGYRFIAEVREISEGSELQNDTAELTSSLSENNLTADDSPKPRKLLVPIAAVTILLIGTIAIGSWYLQTKILAINAPILSIPITSEKLLTNGKVVHAVISPDGENVVYTNGIDGKQGVWIRQLNSGNNVEIIPQSDDVYAGLALSPDGNILYFVRQTKAEESKKAIYRVSIFGGVPDKIIEETEGWISISPDGNKISYVRCYYVEDENCSLWIADSLNGKNEKKLALRPRPFRIGDNKISPDGKTIAFAVGQSENQANDFGLIEVDIESGKERELTKEKFFNIKSLEWLPGKDGLLITASRIPNKNFRIWQVSLDSGNVEPLTKDSETYSVLSLDKTASNLVSTQVKQDFHLYLFDMKNPSVKRVLGDASTASFTPDGHIIFSSPMSGNDEIWIINTDGSRQRQLTNNTSDESSSIAAPDGNTIFFSSNQTGEVHVWRMNADGSNQIRVTKKEGGFPISVSSDGMWVFYHHGRDRTLWRVAAKGGVEQQVIKKGKIFFAVSPDGLRVAFSEKQGEERILTIVSIPDGRTIKTFNLQVKKAKISKIVWLSGGKSFAYTTIGNEYENDKLWLQTINGGTPEKIADLGNEEINSLTFSPDGKEFAIVQGGWKHDAVLLKGLK